MSETKVPALCAPPNSFTPQERSFLLALKELVEVREGRRGDALDASVTFRDLIGVDSTSLSLQTNGGRPRINSLGGTALDSTIPPAISGFTVSGAYSAVILTWDKPLYANHAYVEVWRANTDLLGSAVIHGTTSADVYTDSCGEDKTYYYWARSVSSSDIVGPFNRLNGTLGETSPDVPYLLSILQSQITEDQLIAPLSERINLIDGAESLVGSVASKVAALRDSITPSLSNAFERMQQLESRDLGILNSLESLITVNGGQTTEIALERLARIDGDTSTLNSLANIQASVNTQLASVTSQINTLVQTDTAQAQNINQVSVNLAAANAAIFSEASARASADAALASSIDLTKAELNGSIAGVVSQVDAIVSSTQVLATTINGVIATNDSQSAQIFLEQQARISADSANTSSLELAKAELNGTIAGVVSQVETLITGTESIAATLDSILVNNDSQTSEITIERLARIDGDSSNAASLELAKAELNGTIAGVISQADVLATSTQALASTVDSILVTNAGQTSQISQERQARIDGDSSNVVLINSVASQLGGSIASLQSVVNTNATASTAVASRVDSLQSTVSGVQASVSNETQARTAADGALASQISNLSVSTNSSLSAATTRISVLEGNDLNLASRIDALIVESGGSTSDIYLEQQARIAGDQANATQIAGLSTKVGVAESAIVSESTTRASQDQALSTQIGSLSTAYNSNKASVQSQISSLSNADSALVTSTNTLAARVNSVNSSGVSIESAYAAQASTNGTLNAQYTVKVNNTTNKWVTGFGIAQTTVDGQTVGSFTILADKFSIAPSNTNPNAVDGAPFFHTTTAQVINGVTVPAGTYMKAAYISDASITTAKIKDAAIDSAKIADLAVTDAKIGSLSADKITAGAITAAISIQAPVISAAVITGGAISGSSLTASTIVGGTITGGEIEGGVISVPTNTAPKFYVAADGKLTATEATISGNINATSGNFSGTLNVKSAATGARLEISNDVIKVYDAAGVLRVQIGNLAV